MTETLSIRIDSETKHRLDALSKRVKRSKSLLAAEAIGRLRRVGRMATGRAGIAELDSGQQVSHEKVSQWLKTWGKPGETQAPK